MSVLRFSSRREALDQVFLAKRLQGARSYKRIAGYFRSSIFDLIGEELSSIEEVKIVCNSALDRDDLNTLSQAMIDFLFREQWNEEAPQSSLLQREDYGRLHQLLSRGNIEIRVVPEKKLFLHGKAGVIELVDGSKTSFIGSVNETRNAFRRNYELVWEDRSSEAVAWVEEEFDALWEQSIPLPAVILEEIQRLAEREEVPIDQLRRFPNALPGAALAESPIYRAGTQLQPWQRAFVAQFLEYRERYDHARLLLADEVGLGKTLSLGTCALMTTLLNDGPVLILAPSTLTLQWQQELQILLGMPTAVWTAEKGKKGWLDHTGHFLPASQGFRSIAKCPCQIAIVSTGLITRGTEECEELQKKRFGLIILDEAHKARRTWTKGEQGKEHNNLLDFMRKAATLSRHVLLGSATPIQTDPQDLWDLMGILCQNAPHVFGTHGGWDQSNRIFPLITGREYLSNEQEAWDLIRNPLPHREEHDLFGLIRSDLWVDKNQSYSDQPFSSLGQILQEEFRQIVLCKEKRFFEKHNPIVRHTVRRSRKELEDEELLPRIEVTVHPRPEGIGLGYDHSFIAGSLGLSTTASFDRAYRAAEEYTSCLKQRMAAAGFIKTLMLRRICSSYAAGIATAGKLLRHELIELDNLEQDNGYEESDSSPLAPQTEQERAALQCIVDSLSMEQDHDPKFKAVHAFLTQQKSDDKTWLEHGCILFSQYYDTALWMAQSLAKSFGSCEPIALYAGTGKSRLIVGNLQQDVEREEIKKRVREKSIRLVVATNAACEGLNLQTLGTLINIDLPWNPAVLEQRLGRIKRIGQARSRVDFLNLVYQDTVDETVYEVLSARMRDSFDLFGALPETIHDEWIELEKEELEIKIQESMEKNPEVLNAFKARYRNDLLPEQHRWERCAKVLSRRDIFEVLSEPW
ncbi:MAG: DEAD/DEAH box helicase family protein [Verrucomicrobia bacterium]|nr:DEAD/DEAH box helicase family protein [Verrucomicrobiota bacterium]